MTTTISNRAPSGRSSSSGSIIDIKFTLRTVFHKNEFRGCQREIIESALAGDDLFVILPTGHGKSLTFQLPAVAANHGCTIVISPLLALMEAQTRALRLQGIPAASLNSLISPDERQRIIDDLVRGHPRTRLLYVSPELCATTSFRAVIANIIRHKELNRIVVDEAHCCVDWNTFRSPYKELSYFKREYPHIPITALTATASQTVANKIKATLGLDPSNLKVFTTSVNRPNIHYEIRFLETPYIPQDIAEYLKSYNERLHRNRSKSSGSGIIYCRRRYMTERLADALRKEGIAAHSFHSDMSKAAKSRILKNWLENNPKYQVIVATVAFGMGIDKPDCRFVIHYDVPSNIQTYYQACGRAGRDGRAARCILYYSKQDASMLASLQGGSVDEGSSSAAGKDGDGFRHMIEYCQTTNKCRHLQLAEYFGESVPDRPTQDWCDRACDFCKDPEGLQRRAVLAADSESW